jgi:hypothetical protein
MRCRCGDWSDRLCVFAFSLLGIITHDLFLHATYDCVETYGDRSRAV